MKLNGTRTIPASQQKVWNFLIDPNQLAKCMPGCESLEETGENEYSGVIKVGVAAIKGVYNGKVKMEEIQPPSHYKLNLDGKGKQGFLKGSGTVDLEEQDGQTLLTYHGDIQIGGLLASVGQRMVGGVAKMLIGQFFTAMEAEIQAMPDEEVKQGALVNIWRTLVKWIRSILGQGD
jgi:carbon monoxide dehydrogenase subunit G